jgi:hypothetical protein
MRKMILVPVFPGVVLACTNSGHLLGSASRGDGGGMDGNTSERGGDAGAVDGPRLSCSGLGAPIRLPTAAGPQCASVLSQRSHRFALCSCDSVNVTARINTDFFDSTGASVALPPPAAVGINGDLQSSNIIQILGSVYVAGAGGITTSERVVALGSLYVAGPSRALPPASVIDVAGDAYVGGDVDGALLVGGTVHIDPGADTSRANISGGEIVEEPVTVAPPCDCRSNVVELGAAIASAMSNNDNQAAGIAADRLAAVTTSTVLDVPCGSFALTAIDAQQAVFLAVHGRALVAVAGDVVLRAGLTVTLDPGAELDLVVGGRLVASGGNPVGSVAPARFRIWVAGSPSIVFDDAPTVGAVIHAADAQLMASSGLELSGGLLARGVVIGGQLNLHFDHAVLSSGAACGEPATPAVQ